MKKSFEFDFKKGDFVIRNGNVVTVEGVDALKVWICKILHTQLNKYALYNGTGYGSNISNLVVGKIFAADYTQSELIREIKAALLKNTDITEVTSVDINIHGGVMSAVISLKTVYGAIEEVFNYDY